MRKAFFLVTAGATIVACAASTVDPRDLVDVTDAAHADSSAFRNEAGTFDGSLVDGSGDDAAPSDAGKDAHDARAEAGDGSASEAGRDAADATDGGTFDASDAACVVPLGNFAFCGTASSTSVYSSSYPASAVNDGVLTSSWYAMSSACPGNMCPGAMIRVDVVFDVLRTVGRIALSGNRDSYPTGYDVLSARLELLDGAGAVVHSADVTTTRGNEPNGDVDHIVSPAVASVKAVRVIVLTAESGGPGLGEVRAFAN